MQLQEEILLGEAHPKMRDNLLGVCCVIVSHSPMISQAITYIQIKKRGKSIGGTCVLLRHRHRGVVAVAQPSDVSQLLIP